MGDLPASPPAALAGARHAQDVLPYLDWRTGNCFYCFLWKKVTSAAVQARARVSVGGVPPSPNPTPDAEESREGEQAAAGPPDGVECCGGSGREARNEGGWVY